MSKFFLSLYLFCIVFFLSFSVSAVAVGLPAEGAGNSNSNIWTVFSVLITAVISPIVWAVINKHALKPLSPQTEKEKIIEGKGERYDVTDMSNDSVNLLKSMWEKIATLEAAQNQWTEERRELVGIINDLRRHNVALALGLRDWIAWVDAGAKGTPPSVADHVREIVAKAIELTKE